MKKLKFYKISPGGNTTILITNPIIDNAKERASLAKILMNDLHLGAEQVGYISSNDKYPRLDMMGGEFCGNATRSLATILAYEEKFLKKDEDFFTGKVEVSGVSQPLKVKVRKNNDLFDAAIEMPLEVDSDIIPGVSVNGKEMNIVCMEGIKHVMIAEDEFPFEENNFQQISLDIRKELKLENEPAVGCIWYKKSGDIFGIKPIVWVRDTDSTYYETACGSGTLALGMFLAWKKNIDIDKLKIKQPSGEYIYVSVELEEGRFREAWIGGVVKIIAKGEVFV